MDLKSIKATELNFTENKFKSSAQQHFIVKPLAALKNTSLLNKTNGHHLSGYRAESAVVRLLLKSGWSLEYVRARTPISEIDLIFSRGEEIFLIEVKRLNSSWRAFERIRPEQVRRLQRNQIFLASHLSQFQFRSFIAWVSLQNEVTFVSIE